jgi:nucleoside-diphosphate-sugar epimerase
VTAALVIGGSRFVGPELVRRLVDRGVRVTVFNRGTRGDPVREAIAVRGDRNVRSDLERVAASRPDIVFDTCCYDAAQADAAAEIFRGVGRYVYVSSVAAYHEPGLFPIDENAPLGTWAFWGDYGARKAAADARFLHAHRTTGFPVVIVRPTYVLGPNNHVEREAFFVARLLREIPIVLPGNGETLVHFTFACELADALVALGDVRGVEGTAFNVASDHATTLGRFVHLCAAALGVSATIAPADPAEVAFSLSPFDPPQVSPFGTAHVLVSNERIKRATALRFAPLEERLGESVRWYGARQAVYPVRFRPIEKQVLGRLGIDVGEPAAATP